MSVHIICETTSVMVPISSYKDMCMMVLVCSHIVHTDEITLNFLAQERGFSVRDVPRDGNSLFSSGSATGQPWYPA